jgi:hypothetical protein
MNHAYFVTNEHISVEQAIFPRGRTPDQKRLMIRLDNCSVHTSEASADWLADHGIRRMPHPPHLFTWFSSQWLLLVSCNQRKTRTDLVGWRGPVFWVAGKDFVRSRSIGTEPRISGLSTTSSRSKSRQGNGDYVRWQTICTDISSTQFHQTGLAPLFLDQTIIMLWIACSKSIWFI